MSKLMDIIKMKKLFTVVKKQVTGLFLGTKQKKERETLTNLKDKLNTLNKNN